MVKTNAYAFAVAQANSCKTIKELAETSKVSASTIYRIGKGYLVRPVHVGKVAKALGISAAELIISAGEEVQGED